MKGVPDPIEVFELTGAGQARTRLQAAALRGLTRFIGRDAEIEHLRRVLGQAGASRGQMVAIVGEAGVGKSRLVYEFTHSHRVQDWLILEASSVSYGKATSYLAVIDLLKGYFKIGDRDDHREMRDKVLGRVLGLDRALEPILPALLALLDVPVQDPARQNLDPPQRRQRTLDAVKRLLLRESQVQPLLVVFEDLHWVDDETQALLDSLVESLGSARLLLLVNYRPEYEHRWGSKSVYSQLRLDSLPAESAAELLAALLGPDPGLAPLTQMLVKRGNPFFLEETVRTLVETGALAGERGAYRLTRPVEALQVPATGSRQSWRRGSTGCRPRTSACFRRPRSSARTCRSLSSRGSLNCSMRCCAKVICTRPRSWPARLATIGGSAGSWPISRTTSRQQGIRTKRSRTAEGRSRFARRRGIQLFQQVVTTLAGARAAERFGEPGPPAQFASAFLGWSLAELGRFDEAVAVGEVTITGRRAEVTVDVIAQAIAKSGGRTLTVAPHVSLLAVLRRAARYHQIRDDDLNGLVVLVERRRSHLDQSLIWM